MSKIEKNAVQINKEDVDIIYDTCYSICIECAQIHGAKMPYEDYTCTAWTGKCDVCKDLKCCTAIRDWKWPGKHWEWID